METWSQDLLQGGETCLSLSLQVHSPVDDASESQGHVRRVVAPSDLVLLPQDGLGDLLKDFLHFRRSCLRDASRLSLIDTLMA